LTQGGAARGKPHSAFDEPYIKVQVDFGFPTPCLLLALTDCACHLPKAVGVCQERFFVSVEEVCPDIAICCTNERGIRVILTLSIREEIVARRANVRAIFMVKDWLGII
jgi:hypothetical protein